jgi:hypothetical protein
MAVSNSRTLFICVLVTFIVRSSCLHSYLLSEATDTWVTLKRAILEILQAGTTSNIKASYPTERSKLLLLVQLGMVKTGSCQ